MSIEINEDVIKKFKTEKLSLEEYLILLLLYQKEFELLNLLDDFNRCTRSVLVYQKLFRMGYLEMDSSDSENLFKLTEKSIKLLNEN